MAAPTVLIGDTLWDAGVAALTPGLPTGWAVGDYLVVVIATANQAITVTTSGYTQLAVSPQGNGTAGTAGAVGLYAFGKYAQSGEVDPDTSDSGDHQVAVVMAIRGVDGTNPVDIYSGGVISTATANITLTSPGSTTGPDRTIIAMVVSDRDSAVGATFSAWADANLAGITEIFDDGSGSGFGSNIGIMKATLASAGAVGNITVSQQAAYTAAWAVIAFKPSGGSNTYPVSVTEGLSLADSVSGGSTTYQVSVTEGLSLSDTVSQTATQPVRYIRDHLNGSSGNAASYWCEIQALDSTGTNIAAGKTVTGSFVPGGGSFGLVVDGNTSSASYLQSNDVSSNVIIDLGATYNIASVKRFHYYDDGRTFYDTKTETSVDRIKWTTIFDSKVSGTYAETSAGKSDVTLPPPASSTGDIATLIPSYNNNSGGMWTTYGGTADTVESIAIVNINSGPGAAYDSAYNTLINNFRAAGGKVIGYVSTSYAGSVNTARTTTAVNADVASWNSWYTLDGIFLDEMTTVNVAWQTSYYSTVYSYIKGLQPTWTVVGNAGYLVDPVYVSTPLCDICVIFEQTAAIFEQWTMPVWTGSYAASKFAWMIHAASSSQALAAVGRSRYENTKYVFATDDVLANPWDVVPTYWTTEADAMPNPYGAEVSEAISLGDTVSAVKVMSGSVTEAASLGDSESSVATFPVSVTEAFSLNDSRDAAGIYKVSLSEAATLGATQDATLVAGAFVGNLSVSETGADATSSFSGNSFVVGDLSSTEGIDTISSSGAVISQGAMTVTESYSADTAALSGVLGTGGVMSVTEAASDSPAITGVVFVVGSLSSTEELADYVQMFGFNSSSAMNAFETGTPDTFVANGQSEMYGTLSASGGAADSISMSGAVACYGSASAAESSTFDTSSILGGVTANGVFSVVEVGSDSAAMSSALVINGALSVAEDAVEDDATSDGDVSSSGSISISEPAVDAIVSSATAPSSGSMSISDDANDAMVADGLLATGITLYAVESSVDTISSSSSVVVVGAMDIPERTDIWMWVSDGTGGGQLGGGGGSYQIVGYLPLIDFIAISGIAIAGGRIAAPEPANDSCAIVGVIRPPWSAESAGRVAIVPAGIEDVIVDPTINVAKVA